MSTRGAPEQLPGIAAHPHARAILEPAIAPGGRPSHAYLFHGPPGTGKRAVARAFAAALLAGETGERDAVAGRIARASHPDLTWVAPSGAAEMLVSDIDEPVVSAATRTPFESSRRVFVLESAQTMSEQVANRLLKTLEEPPPFVHLILLTDRPQDMLATVASRCQAVRFDPLAPDLIERDLLARGVEPAEARACARLARGDAGLAAALTEGPGRALRTCAESFIRAAIAGRAQERRWGELLELARSAGAGAASDVGERLAEELELLPSRERRRHEREVAEAARRADRRARTRALDLALGLAELWLRDVWMLIEGASELIDGVDRLRELEADARLSVGADLPRALGLVCETRLRLPLNVSEELALEALSYRLASLLVGAAA
jgi:DNA polymerase-3 subunit delta'